MFRFFLPQRNITGDKIVIEEKEQVHYIRDVLRLKTQDQLIAIDASGNEYKGKIEKLSHGKVVLNIIDRLCISASKNTQVSVACAIPKKAKMDDIVDKLTQLGVDRIIPLKTNRVVVKFDDYRKEIIRWQRWKEKALNASQQSKRRTLPVVEAIKDIKEVLSGPLEYDLKLIFTLVGKRKPLKEVFSKVLPNSVLVLIGPEGDFTEQEVGLAIERGFIPVTLGELVLRVDTAAIAVTSFIKLST